MSESRIPITRKIIQFLAKPEITCQVIFVTKETTDDEVDIKLQYMDVEIDSMNTITTQCMSFVSKREDWIYEEYGQNRDEVLIKKYFVENMVSIPNKKIFLKETSDQITTLDDQFINSIKSIQIRFQVQGKTVIFFRKFTKKNILSHKKGILKMISGILQVNKDHIIEVPQNYDCCKYGNEMGIFHPDNFEDLFDYHEIHAKIHKEIFNHLKKNIDYTIVGVDEMKEQMLKQPQKLRKLPAIKEKGMYLWSFKQVVKFLKERPVNTIEINHKKKSINFKNVFAMMHFYNDAHLDSKATDTSYFTTTKAVE